VTTFSDGVVASIQEIAADQSQLEPQALIDQAGSILLTSTEDLKYSLGIADVAVEFVTSFVDIFTPVVDTYIEFAGSLPARGSEIVQTYVQTANGVLAGAAEDTISTVEELEVPDIQNVTTAISENNPSVVVSELNSVVETTAEPVVEALIEANNTISKAGSGVSPDDAQSLVDFEVAYAGRQGALVQKHVGIMDAYRSAFVADSAPGMLLDFPNQMIDSFESADSGTPLAYIAFAYNAVA